MSIPNPTRIRKRDMAAIVCVSVCAASSLFVTACYWLNTRHAINDFSERVESVETLAIDSTNATATALAFVLQLQDNAKPAAVAENPDMVSQDSSVSENPDAVTEILGYGQTRSKTARYLYRDTRHADGSTRREYIARYPLSQ